MKKDSFLREVLEHSSTSLIAAYTQRRLVVFLNEQRSLPLNKGEGSDTDFKYIANIRAFETFRNVVRALGISIPETAGARVSFVTPRRLDMKAYKERGLIWSYSIIRVRRVEEVVEEG